MQQASDRLKALTPMATRRALVRARFAARRPLGGHRLLPQLLVIGTMRGGTSSLYKYLGGHPCVAPSLRKEVEYLTLHYDRGLDWYRAHFPVTARRTAMEFARRGLLTFEATPYYLFHPHAAARAARLLPEARLVVLLRDPVERAYSHHQHMTRHGHEHLSFADSLAAEEERIGSETDRLLEDPSYVSLPHHRYSYVARGRYVDQLERWLACFPPERFLILRSEDFYAAPKASFQAVLNFLDLPSWEPWEFRNHSYADGHRPRSAPIEDDLRQRLRTHFNEANVGLERLVDFCPAW